VQSLRPFDRLLPQESQRDRCRREDVRRGERCGNSDEYHVLEHLGDGVGDKDDLLSMYQLTPNAQEFMRSPWFSRAWVVQEVWAARELVVLCGSTKARVSWENVRQVNLYLSARANRFGAINSEGINKPRERKYTTISGAKSIWRRLKNHPSAASAPIPAAELLDMVAAGLQASDPRDFLFSILGMSVETSGRSSHTPLSPPTIPNLLGRSSLTLLGGTSDTTSLSTSSVRFPTPKEGALIVSADRLHPGASRQT
jgi:hypothetical protein